MVRHWDLRLRVLAAICSGLLFIALGLVRFGVFSLEPAAETALVLFTAGTAALGSFYAIYREKRRRDENEFMMHAHRRALEMLLRVNSATTNRVKIESVGIAVFAIAPRPWYRRFGKSPLGLDRIYRHQSESVGSSTGIKWTVGKGVVGICAQSRSAKCIDNEALLRGHAETTAERWSKLPHTTTQGLSHSELQNLLKSGEPLGVVSAVPIYSSTGKDRRVVAVVALDAPAGSDIKTQLEKNEVRSHLKIFGEFLADYLV